MDKLKRYGFSVALLLLALLFLAAPVAADDGPVDEKLLVKIDPELLRELDSSRDGTSTFLVYLGRQADLRPARSLTAEVERRAWVYDALRLHADRAQAGIRAYLETAQRTGRVRAYTPLWIVNGLSVTADATVLWELAARDEVERIAPERQYRLTAGSGPGIPGLVDLRGPSAPATVEWNIAQINADDVWATYGVTGSGVLVASIDSGVRYDHAALVNAYAGNTGTGFDHDYYWFDAIDGATVPYDDNGHGTHTMGTIVGDDGAGNQIGVAPGARWISVKAFNAAGGGTSTALHEAFQWILAPCDSNGQNCDPARAPRIVSNSWGSPDGSRTEFLADVQALRAAGIWPVFSAGNEGPRQGTLGSPGSFAESFAAGATNTNDVIATFSSLGPSPLTPEIKPEVTAPGVDVRSSLNDGGYIALSGTSMACPHVSGLGALLLSAEPGLTIDQIEDLVTTTALDLGDAGPDMVYGYGRIDALAAMQRLLSSGHLTGIIRDTATSAPIAHAEVNVRGAGYDLNYTANASGVYSATYLIAGTYAVTASYYGYESASVSGVTVITDTVSTQNLSLTALPTHILSGRVTEAGTGVPLTATVRVLGTPLPSAPTDATGYYSIVVAEGEYDVEAHSFAHTTDLQHVVVDRDRTVNFELAPMPPILLVDDDEGDLRDYSPHVQDYFLAALEANDYNFSYWDIEAQAGAPDFDTMRQYAAVVWFGGEFGRVKDVSDASQAQALMDYLDLGGQLFYTAQEHTFYYGDDAVCDTDPAACPFTYAYLDLGGFVEDRRAEVVNGVAGDPVGDGLGPYTSQFPPFELDLSDEILPGLGASATFTASSRLDLDHVTAHTYYSATHGYKVVFMAYPFEALPAVDAADVMVRIMNWFGIRGAEEGITLAPAFQRKTEFPGTAADFVFRVRNLNASPEIYNLRVLSTTLDWPSEIVDAGFTAAITELGPVPPGGTADFGLRVQIPAGATPGAFDLATVEARTQSLPAYFDVGTAATHARMTYYILDNDVCGTGVHFDWVDATGGVRHDIGGDGEPTYFSATLPLPFTFYNQSYDHVYVNECGSLIFGDDNIYDDCYPTVDPPIPEPSILDPNNAIHTHWGTLFWNPGYDPEQAIYTRHETGGGRNRFVVEWHRWDSLLGDSDTFEAILDLDSNEIIMQYMTATHVSFANVGIENAFGTEGLLYVSDNEPAEHRLHDRLAVKFGVGQVGEVNEVFVLPWWDERTVEPGGVATYTLTISNTSSVSDSFKLEVGEADWPTTFWDPTFTVPLSGTGLMESCTTLDVGARVDVPADAWAYQFDRVSLGARSLRDTLILGSAPVTTIASARPNVAWWPDASQASAVGPPAVGQEAWHTLSVVNTGNVTETFFFSVTDAAWGISFWDVNLAQQITRTSHLPPQSSQAVRVWVQSPPWTYAGTADTATLWAVGQTFSRTLALATVTTTLAIHPDVDWLPQVNSKDDTPGRTVPYLVEVRNRGNVDDRYTLEVLDAEWTTSLWNSSFTQPLTRTELLMPGQTQRLGVRVRIPPSVRSPALDTALLRATSTYTPTLRADAWLVTRVARPAPGNYGVSVTPSARLGTGALLDLVTHVFTVTNLGIRSDTFDLTLRGAEWPTFVAESTSELAPGTSSSVRVVVLIPGDLVIGDWDQVVLLVASRADSSVQDAAAAVTVSRVGETTRQRLYLPLVVKAYP